MARTIDEPVIAEHNVVLGLTVSDLPQPGECGVQTQAFVHPWIVLIGHPKCKYTF